MAMDSRGVNQGSNAASVHQGWRMECSTKVTHILQQNKHWTHGDICGHFIGSGIENHCHSSFKTILLTRML